MNTSLSDLRYLPYIHFCLNFSQKKSTEIKISQLFCYWELGAHLWRAIRSALKRSNLSISRHFCENLVDWETTKICYFYQSDWPKIRYSTILHKDFEILIFVVHNYGKVSRQRRITMIPWMRNQSQCQQRCPLETEHAWYKHFFWFPKIKDFW